MRSNKATPPMRIRRKRNVLLRLKRFMRRLGYKTSLTKLELARAEQVLRAFRSSPWDLYRKG